jgi:hypothetical protein
MTRMMPVNVPAMIPAPHAGWIHVGPSLRADGIPKSAMVAVRAPTETPRTARGQRGDAEGGIGGGVEGDRLEIIGIPLIRSGYKLPVRLNNGPPTTYPVRSMPTATTHPADDGRMPRPPHQ